MLDFFHIKDLKNLITKDFNAAQVRLIDIARETLEREKWPLSHLLSLVCGLQFMEFFKRQEHMQMFSEDSPNNLVGVFHQSQIIDSTKRLFLMGEIPKTLESFKNSFIFSKHDLGLIYITYHQELINLPFKINKHKLRKLVSKHKELPEDKPLQVTLTANERKHFYDLILQSRLSMVFDDIVKIYKKLLKEISVPESEGRLPAEYLDLLQQKNLCYQTYNLYNVDGNKILRINYGFSGINAEIAKIITYRHFGLEKKTIENGLDRGVPLSIEQAAELLTKHLGRSVNTQQVLDYALLADSFNVYINSGYSDDKIKSTMPSIKHVEGALKEGWLSPEHKYHYSGLIRLAKDCNESFAKQNEQTVKHLAHGNTIKIGLRHRSLYRSLSVSGYISGELAIIEMKVGKNDITINDLLFIEKELIYCARKLNHQKNIKKFNWQDFYCEDNGKIIRELIKSKSILIEEFVEIMCLEDLGYDYRQIMDSEDFKKRFISEGKLICIEGVLEDFINKQILPITIKRLPRDLGYAIATGNFPENTNYIKDYYPEYAKSYYLISKDDAQAIDELIRKPLNYSRELPSLWSYNDLNERWKNNHQLEIFSECSKIRLGAYLKVSQRAQSAYYVKTSYWKESSLQLLSIDNLGNPFYLKRYEGLERLSLHDIHTLFHHSHIKQSSAISIFLLQATDLEKKFHIKRNLYPSGKYIHIDINDIVFLAEEVEKIERECNADQANTSIKTNKAVNNQTEKSTEKTAMKVIKVGLNRIEQQHQFGKKSGEERSGIAKDSYEKTELPKAIEITEKSPGTHSASSIARIIYPDDSSKKDTLRKKLGKEPRIIPSLKPNNRRREKTIIK